MNKDDIRGSAEELILTHKDIPSIRLRHIFLHAALLLAEEEAEPMVSLERDLHDIYFHPFNEFMK